MTATPATGVWAYAPEVVHDYLCANPAHTELPPNDPNYHPRGVLDPAIRVSTKIPATRPGVLVTISTAPTNGGRNLALSPRRIILHCYHPNEAAAGNLAETIFAHMLSAAYTSGNGIRNVTVVGTPALFPDPDDSTPRFQMTLDILLRATF